MQDIRIIEFPHASERWREAVELRYKILRQPLGLQFTAEELAREVSDFHLGAVCGSSLVGCVVLTPVDKHTIRMRQLAVDPDHRRQGIGKLLVRHAETLAREKEFQHMILHARQHVTGFYRKLGYRVTGDRFIEVTIPHFPMEKPLF